VVESAHEVARRLRAERARYGDDAHRPAPACATNLRQSSSPNHFLRIRSARPSGQFAHRLALVGAHCVTALLAASTFCLMPPMTDCSFAIPFVSELQHLFRSDRLDDLRPCPARSTKAALPMKNDVVTPRRPLTSQLQPADFWAQGDQRNMPASAAWNVARSSCRLTHSGTCLIKALAIAVARCRSSFAWSRWPA
jgi:hypothetical protein